VKFTSDGKVLVHCHAGCTPEDICAAMGIEMSDLFLDNHQGPPTKAASKPNGSVRSQPFQGTELDVDRMQCDLVKNVQVQGYIDSRGVSLRVASDLKWGATAWRFRDEQDHWLEKPALAAPHYHAGKLVGIKFRTIYSSKLFSQILGSTIDGLYGLGTLDPKTTEVSVFEGPEDIALAMSHGFNAVGLIAADSKLANSDIAALLRYQRIYLVGDQDVAGQRAIDALEQCLPAEQAIRVRMPGYKDVGDLWKSKPKEFHKNFAGYSALCARLARPL
jgi:hypothetical protein